MTMGCQSLYSGSCKLIFYFCLVLAWMGWTDAPIIALPTAHICGCNYLESHECLTMNYKEKMKGEMNN